MWQAYGTETVTTNTTTTSSISKAEFKEFSTEDVSLLEEEVKKLDAVYGHNNIRVIADVEYSVSVDVVEEQLSTDDSIDGDTDVTENNNSESLLDSQFAAAKDLGIRMYASRGSMDLSKKDGGLPPDSVVQSIDDILKDCQRVVEKYHDSSKYSMNMVALAPCAPFNVTGELLKQSAVLARDLKVRLHTHLCETKDEEVFVREKFNMRPLEYMESLGWVGEDVWYAHGIHFNEKELKYLADTKTGVAHCPISNMKLSSGVCRIPEMLELGVPVGLAVDGSASNDGSSLLEEMRVCYLLHRLNSSDKAPSAYDILKIATNGGSKVLGRDDIGSLEIGKAGDLFMIDMRKLEMVGANFDPKSLFGTIGWKNTVDYTVVNGKVVVEKGKIITIDEEKIYKLADDTENKYLSKSK